MKTKVFFVVVCLLFILQLRVYAQDTISYLDSLQIRIKNLALTGEHDTVKIGALLKPGDAIQITVFPDTGSFLSGNYILDKDGSVNLPMLGHFRVDTISFSVLGKRLAGLYLRYLKFPFVRITPLIRVGFTGGFLSPGFYYLNPDVSLWEAVRQSGGPLRDDGVGLVRWVRGNRTVSGNLAEAIASGHSLRQMGVRSGDLFTVTTTLRKTGWERFSQDVAPVMQVVLATLSTSATLYIVYRTSGGL
jgi:protein involved in polysaccharide export with SLBB domain